MKLIFLSCTSASLLLFALLHFRMFNDSSKARGDALAVSSLSYEQIVDIQDGPSPMSPDEFSWRIFAAINAPVPDVNQQLVKPSDGAPWTHTQDVAWEEWANNITTFKVGLMPDEISAQDPPVFPDYTPSGNRAKAHLIPKSFQQDKVQLLLAEEKGKHAPDRRSRKKSSDPMFEHRNDIIGSRNESGVGGPVAPGTLEEVRRNRESFDYLIRNGLWNDNGIQRAVLDNVNTSFDQSVFNMPRYSIEVKAEWHMCGLIDPVCTSSHMNYASDGKKYALIALHVMTKDQTKWVFSSWEWAGNAGSPKVDGNPGRCDVIGCVDHFGISDGPGTSEGITSPLSRTETTNQYLPGAITSTLEALFLSYNLAPEWRNYRLKMTQVDFTDNKGNATLGGNSQIESGYIATSSCISCHSRAAANRYGVVNPKGMNIIVGQSGSIGPMQATWFNDPTNSATGPRIYYRVDYIWSLLNASPAAKLNIPGR